MAEMKLSERLNHEARRLTRSYIDPGFPRYIHSEETRELLNQAYGLALAVETMTLRKGLVEAAEAAWQEAVAGLGLALPGWHSLAPMRAALEAVFRAPELPISVTILDSPPPQAAGGEPVAYWIPNGRTMQDGSWDEGPGYVVDSGEATEFEKKHGTKLFAHPPAVGQEWVVVPRVMTFDMEVAFCEAWFSKKRCVDDADMQDAYAAMIEAAPAQPAGGGAQ